VAQPEQEPRQKSEPESADEVATTVVAIAEATEATAATAPTVPTPPAPAFGAPAGPGAPYAAPQPQPQPQFGGYPGSGDPAAMAAFAPSAPKPRRPFPWRWAGALVVVLAVGSASAYGVLEQKRTDLPGLSTQADGRYDFAPLKLPTLAPGQSDPMTGPNSGSQHISDIRKLLLPAPVGASKDASLPGATGWVSESDSLALLHAGSVQDFATDGWRHTAATAWKTPDGADTKIYLMQFIDDSAAGDAGEVFVAFDSGASDTVKTLTAPGNASVQYSTVRKGSTNTWYGEAQTGDTEFLIEYTAPASVGLAPFEQEVDLQVELLQ
jgi:hypothetical protein